jgi:hypothetical protein
MATLKIKLTTAPILCKIHFNPASGWGLVVLAVDSSLEGWGATLGQYDDKGQKRVARYESGLWSDAEKTYDATKRECRGILKALQKLRFWLYGVHFILETDANVLVAQLNRAATDLPGALVTRWLAWIRLFDFEVRHVKGSRHTAADGLSRRPANPASEPEDTDVDKFIARELDSLGIDPIPYEGRNPRQIQVNLTSKTISDRSEYSESHVNHWSTKGSRDLHTDASEPDSTNNSESSRSYLHPLDDSYGDQYQEIAQYLVTHMRPEGMSAGEFWRLRKNSADYSVRDRLLWRNATKIYPPRLVLDEDGQKSTVLHRLHSKTGHPGRESTYWKVATRYWWRGMYTDVRNFVRSCEPCQKKSKRRLHGALYPMKCVPLWHRCSLDVVKLPNSQRGKCLIVARDDFSNWPEARVVRKATAKALAKFIRDDVICRHGVVGEMKMDGGSEFKGAVIKELKRMDIKRCVISAYNPKANGQVERGHQSFKDAFIALTEGGKGKWLHWLSWVLLADRTTVHGPTGFTPFYMVYGREAILPIETEFPTWRTLGWEKVRDLTTLLEFRARQFAMRDEDVDEAKLRKDRRRAEG